MKTLEINVPDEKTPFIKALLKEQGITVKVKRDPAKKPNQETMAAMKELKEGRGKQFETVDALFTFC